MDAQREIQTLIRRWVDAVDRADLEGVLADHTDDIVMFDVPPPHAGHRGMAEYRAAWPEFLAWQAGGARFELTELEVTAGKDVAFAHALLRCGPPEWYEAEPGKRLRLTFGLRREDRRWRIAHEHHSFVHPSP
ncbi:SgcJ/EcaC family oxidoreductase [Solirubrobacter sp. CPCC 204708]|uniref:SgcJ/EcaC family oxidoreductase n=1 Tax=Solirubrobacter deserti TaxID=2282478 RepID=A0ABT4RRZ1_9ACTN|nr:SgcJ/EcaC family oxidoreductase [Solirubrobacter deserti]MBE2318711.1 SgcJ/EcaC family oxidoreductase [Solirubrobacter deserti]MDA0141301.1 SgcJ/EcaC family oxidoreductase [Solirubrobacter deserti]